MRALRPDRMTYAMAVFIEEKLGYKYSLSFGTLPFLEKLIKDLLISKEQIKHYKQIIEKVDKVKFVFRIEWHFTPELHFTRIFCVKPIAQLNFLSFCTKILHFYIFFPTQFVRNTHM